MHTCTLCLLKYYYKIIIARPKLRDLVGLKVAPEWYSLGLQLKLTEDALNIIEKDDGQDSPTCRRKMFSKWLSSNKDASYTDLVDALVVINKEDVAENVSQKFCKYLDNAYHVPICQVVVDTFRYSACVHTTFE